MLDENELGKAKGDYVSIECKDLYDHDIREQMVDAILENLQHMSANMNIKMKKILVVGLGNRFITSDALGPGEMCIRDRCMDNDIDLVVFNMNESGNILKAVRGDITGTVISKDHR